MRRLLLSFLILAASLLFGASAFALTGGIGPGQPERPGSVAEATFYGKGSFRLASGARVVSERDLFVAHKKLPFRTRVQFQKGKETVTARVLDRGPYVEGVGWDLSWRAARELGILSEGRAEVRVRILGR